MLSKLCVVRAGIRSTAWLRRLSIVWSQRTMTTQAGLRPSKRGSSLRTADRALRPCVNTLIASRCTTGSFITVYMAGTS